VPRGLTLKTHRSVHCLILNKYRLVPCTGLNLVFIIESESVHCAVRALCLNLAHVDLNLSRIQYCNVHCHRHTEQSFVILFNNASYFVCSYGSLTVIKYVFKTRANIRILWAHEIHNKIVKFKYKYLHNFENFGDFRKIFLSGNYLTDRLLKYWQIFKYYPA